MSIQPNTSLFHIGLATPMSSILQLILCVGFMLWLRKKGMLSRERLLRVLCADILKLVHALLLFILVHF